MGISWPSDSRSTGEIRWEGRERGDWRPELGKVAAAAIAGGEELAGVW
jgi:hypothetical protein